MAVMIGMEFGTHSARVCFPDELLPGGQVTMSELLRQDLKESAQDAAVQMAEHLLQAFQTKCGSAHRAEDTNLRVVLSTPIRYGLRGRELLISALSAQGAQVEAALYEAEAFAYAFLHGKADVSAQVRILVFHLDAEGCESTALLFHNGVPFQLLGHAYEPFGVVEWDERIQNLLGDQILAALDDNTPTERAKVEQLLACGSLREEAGAVRESLKRQSLWEGALVIDGRSFSVQVSQSQFEKKTGLLLERMAQEAQRVAGVERVDYVLLTGEAAEMPWIRTRMGETFPDSEIGCSDEQNATALVAAVYDRRDREHSVSAAAEDQRREAATANVLHEQSTSVEAAQAEAAPETMVDSFRMSEDRSALLGLTEEGKKQEALRLPQGIRTIAAYALAESQAVRIHLPKSLRVIEEGAFFHCQNLREMAFPYGLEKLGEAAFKQCSALRHVTIPASVRSIGAKCFCMCTGLKRVQLSEGLERIEDEAFFLCTSLTERVLIPESVRYIGQNCFECRGLGQRNLQKGLLDFQERTDFSGIAASEMRREARCVRCGRKLLFFRSSMCRACRKESQ